MVDLAKLISRTGNVWGLGLNCFKADVATTLVPRFISLLAETELHCILYPDNGQVWNAETRSFDGLPTQPDEWAKQVYSWHSSGIPDRLVVGGCCQTTPAHINALKHLLEGQE